MADKPTLRLVETMKKSGDLDNAVLFFFSDHGIRLSSFVHTHQGNMEGNLPFFLAVFPDWFHKQFPQLVTNLRVNSHRLTTPFDIRKTLLHLLHLQTNATNEWSDDYDGEKRGVSLLTPIPEARDCESAGIPDAFCSCHQLTEVDSTSPEVRNAAEFFVKTVNEALAVMKGECANLTLKEIDEARRKRMRKREGKRNDRDSFVLKLRTEPKGLFKAWIDVKLAGNNHVHAEDAFVVDLKYASRLDRYGNDSACVGERKHLNDFCQCL